MEEQLLELWKTGKREAPPWGAHCDTGWVVPADIGQAGCATKYMKGTGHVGKRKGRTVVRPWVLALLECMTSDSRRWAMVNLSQTDALGGRIDLHRLYLEVALTYEVNQRNATSSTDQPIIRLRDTEKDEYVKAVKKIVRAVLRTRPKGDTRDLLKPLKRQISLRMEEAYNKRMEAYRKGQATARKLAKEELGAT